MCNSHIEKMKTLRIYYSQSRRLHIEEKLAGSQLGIRLLEEGKVQFKSRGSVLEGVAIET